MSALENEITHDSTTFEMFGETWTVPIKRHLSHIKAMRDAMREGVGTIDLLVAETFLSDEEFDRLLDLDPDEDRLKEFADKVSNALGTGDRGN
jgi:hypothetical protein